LADGSKIEPSGSPSRRVRDSSGSNPMRIPGRRNRLLEDFTIFLHSRDLRRSFYLYPAERGRRREADTQSSAFFPPLRTDTGILVMIETFSS
jgi:hypothetical protein